MEIDEKKLKDILAEQQDRTERYIGGLKEDFDHKLDTVLEYVKDTPKMKEEVDVLREGLSEIKPIVEATFEKVGEIAGDVEVTKEKIASHDHRLKVLEAR